MTDLEYIAANLSDEDILCQIAEEASELSKAALKLRRAITGTNPTPVSARKAAADLMEEYGDTVVASVAYFIKHDLIDRKYVDILEKSNAKYSRWAQRIKEGKNHD
ncbi:MAG: hypothetical protein ACI4T6_09850 [Candidatus Flemingiibacterium sp.]